MKTRSPLARPLLCIIMSISALAANDRNDIDALRNHAAEGDVKAQLDLAFRYRDGKGVSKDNAEAMMWAHRAADAGSAEAMDFIGSAYLRGASIKGNPVIALGYFKAAAEESSQAAFNLGQCYFGAQGTEQDIPKALEFWEKAAAAGHGRAAACARWFIIPVRESRPIHCGHAASPNGPRS